MMSETSINIGSLLTSLSVSQKKTVRTYEKARKKLVKAKCSRVFNEVCLRDNIYPKYSNIRLHDKDAQREAFTLDFRRKLIQREVELATEKIRQLESDVCRLKNEVEETIQDEQLLQNLMNGVNLYVEKLEFTSKSTIMKKLQNLYRGKVALPEESPGFINLSKYTPTDAEKEFLQLGLNCHIKPNFDQMKKKVELEILYSDLLQLERKETVELSADLKEQLRAEGTKCRDNSKSTLLTNELKNAAKSLRANQDICIRKSDKSNVYVIMDKEEYLRKLGTIVSDTSKFKVITANPTKELTKKLNTLIEKANKDQPGKFKTITGDYTPGYLYGNVKTHKGASNPLRPIISQVPTPSYDVAKQLDELIKPYIPGKYMLNSRSEFIDILRETEFKSDISSLDVESLFTNVPVKRTISIIMKHVYHHPTLPAPKIPRNVLKQLLLTCTTEVPFYSPTDGKLRVQIDGMTMGSPLGPTFANFYMAELENKVLARTGVNIDLYLRFVDDIFLHCTKEEMEHLRRLLEEESVLKFTYELPNDKKLAFLDVLTDIENNDFTTSVYHKPTDVGRCLNYKSECPDKYKVSVVKSYMKRAYEVSSSWDLFNAEVSRMKQVLINNGFPNYIVDREVQTLMDNINNNNNTNNTQDTIKLYYANQMNNNYKTDETVIKNIIKHNVKPKNPTDNIELIIYYKNIKTKQLVMKNNLQERRQLDITRAIYQYTCPHDVCKHPPNPKVINAYTGFTTMFVTRRLSYHKSNGAIQKHSQAKHGRNPTREELVENTKVRYIVPDKRRLETLEALIIKHEDPEINKQDTGRTRILKLYGYV